MKYEGLKVVIPGYISEDEETLIECPYCDYWEVTYDTNPRNKLNFSVLHWESDKTSVNRCPNCKKMFKINWN